MAPVIAYVAQGLATYFAGAGYGVLSVQALAAYEAAATALVYIGGNLALTAASNALAPRPKGMRGHDVEYAGTVEPRRIIYGTFRVSGQNVIPPLVSGLEGEYLHQVLAVAGHECASINKVFLGTTPNIINASIGAVTGTDADGAVSGGTFWDGKIWIRRYLGTASQTVDYILDTASPDWDSNCRGRGVSYVALRYKYSDKTWQTGKPDITFLVEGKKVYDPRLDVTPGASPTNPSYIAFSNNPALVAADYIMDASLGLGDAAARIDWPTVVTSANICDEMLSVPGTAQKRYTCDTVLVSTDRYEENLELIADSMMGAILYSGGKWYIKAGAWSASAFALTETDLVGPVSVQAELPRRDKWNAVKGQYYDEDRNYQPSEFSPRRTAAYESDDGEVIWREVEWKSCTNEYRAQRNAILMLRRSRRVRTVTADYGLAAWKVRPFETGVVTIAEIGWTAQTVRCVAWEFTPEGRVRLTFREEASTDWADPTSPGDYGAAVAAIAITPAVYTPPAPTALTASSITDGTLLAWSYGDLVPGTFFEVWRHTASTPFASATRVGTTTGTSWVDAGTAQRPYYYWVRASHVNGNNSATEPAATGLSGQRIGPEVCPDSDIQYSATKGVYWDWTTSGGTSDFALSLSGGVSAGIITATIGSGSNLHIFPVRGAVRAVTGQIYEATIRWRRTTAIVGSPTLVANVLLNGSGVFGFADLGVAAALIWDSGQVPFVPSIATAGTITAAQLAAATINEWQERSFRFRLQNNAKSSGQNPYLNFTLNLSSGTSGTLELDSVSCYRVVDTLARDGVAVGYMEVPLATQDGTYTFALTDNGRGVKHSSASAHTWTIDTNANTAFPIGAVITLEAGSASGNVTIAPAGGVTLEWAGSSSTGSRTLAANGLATIYKTATNTWKIAGAGVS